jgi:hypothetical protein
MRYLFLILLAVGCDRSTDSPTVTKPSADVVICDPPGSMQLASTEAEPDEPTEFRFPNDVAGKLLSKQLTPDVTKPLPESPLRQRRAPAPKHLEDPELPLTPVASVPPTMPEPGHKPVLPRLVTAEALSGLLEVALPQAQPMVVGDRVRQPSADVNQPPHLPILARPLPDRASLNDATTDASAAAVVGATIPTRVIVVPFQRQALPDPYENRRPLRLPVPDESATPVTASPRPPQ